MFEKSFSFIKKFKRSLFPFYRNKDLKLLFKILHQDFPDGTIVARFVGGCVRKHLKYEEVDDIDIATILSTNEIKDKFNNTKFKVLDTGISHGTVTLVSNKLKIELTTLRKDIKTDGRHAEVRYIDDWKIDSERRDFTINAIYLDKNGNIFDPQRGIFDLNNNNVKFIGDPNTRIEEDYLRIIRLLRFAIQYDSSNDKTTIDALRSNLNGIKKISKERIFNELMKILSLKNFDNILKHKNKMEIFLKIFPELNHLHRLERFKEIKNIIKLDNVNLLALLLIDNTDNYEYFSYKFNVSKNLTEKLLNYRKCFSLMNKEKNFFKEKIEKNIYLYGKDYLVFLNALKFSDNKKMKFKEYIFTNKKIINTKIPKLKYDGKYLKNQGLKEGPALGKVLKQIESEWINNNFKISSTRVSEIVSTKSN